MLKHYSQQVSTPPTKP